MPNTTVRLDVLVCQKNPEVSRTKAAGLIQRGAVAVDGTVERKPGAKVLADAQIKIAAEDHLLRYVSRAGLKLETALEEFKLDVTGMTVLDAGLSTGGFAHCLLLRGAKHVYGVDVGSDQVDPELRKDKRLTVMEKTDIRNLESLPEQVDLITLDLSFISVSKVLDSVIKFLKPDGKMIILIKPQFEVGKSAIGRGGIVTCSKAHQDAIDQVVAVCEKHGVNRHGVVPVPDVSTGRKNREFVALFVRD